MADTGDPHFLISVCHRSLNIKFRDFNHDVSGGTVEAESRIIFVDEFAFSVVHRYIAQTHFGPRVEAVEIIDPAVLPFILNQKIKMSSPRVTEPLAHGYSAVQGMADAVLGGKVRGFFRSRFTCVAVLSRTIVFFRSSCSFARILILRLLVSETFRGCFARMLILGLLILGLLVSESFWGHFTRVLILRLPVSESFPGHFAPAFLLVIAHGNSSAFLALHFQDIACRKAGIREIKLTDHLVSFPEGPYAVFPDDSLILRQLRKRESDGFVRISLKDFSVVDEDLGIGCFIGQGVISEGHPGLHCAVRYQAGRIGIV